MSDSIQLNLFGDILNEPESDPLIEEQNNELLGASRKDPLEEISSKDVPEIPGPGHPGPGAGEGRPENSRDDRGTGRTGPQDGGSERDRTAADNLSDTRERPGTTSPELGHTSSLSLTILDKKVALDAADIQAIFDQYAAKAAGFQKDSGNTKGMQRVFRPSQGDKLWEEMTPAEQKQEISDYLKRDFDAAQQEVKTRNPAEYLLDRALDPLDPMSEVYKVILKKAGATIERNPIKLPDYLQKSLDQNSNLSVTDTLPRSPGALRNGHTDDRGNYHITADDHIGKGGKVAKFDDNLAAILLLKALETEKRNANPEEQSILVRYTGWGGLSEVFKQNLEGTWLDRQNRLKTALSDEEYRSASRSTINAHYTSPEVVRAVWDGACRLGYSGGPTMEPALGIGHFFGMRPSHLPVEMHGIELDSISGRIAQHLYQSADIKINGYENLRMEKDRYNLFISNVPFADVKPYEEKKNQTPGIDNRYSLHDFYFLKSLHGTRPGGLVAFITSRYTLDKENTEVRSKIAETADFVGAIRLPNNTFRQIADTEVVTDIVFLQKRLENQPMSDLTKSFINTIGDYPSTF